MEDLQRFDKEKAIAVIEVIMNSVEISLRECTAIYQDGIALDKCEEIYTKLKDLEDYLYNNI